MASRKKNGRFKGVVGVPKEYFLRMAKHDYNNYRSALAREFYQNSVDAGATTIEVLFDEDKRKITVSDDGCGMSMNTLKNKLLVLGGSKKRTGSTGAFGKAKEVLFFAWDSYRIQTRDLMVQGSGAEYEIFDSPFEYFEGTKCSITIPEEENFLYYIHAFRSVAAKFEIPHASIYVNGAVIDTEMQRGALVKSNEWADIYHDPKVNSMYLNVRVNGQWMFEKYIGSDDIGAIVVELTKNSADILNSNRDGITGKFSDQFDEFVKEVVVEKKQALKPPKKTIAEFFRGEGSVKVNWEKMMEAMREAMKIVSDQWKEMKTLNEVKNSLIAPISDDKLASQRVGNSLEEMKAKGRTLYDYEDRFTFIGYKPDFVVLYEERDQKSITRFMKTRKARVIAQAWTEVVKQVLLDVDWYGHITCGFDFRGDERAAMKDNAEGTFFFINPDLLLSDLEGIKNPLSHRRLLKEDLLLCAIHEVAHLEERYHDGDFVLRSEWTRAQTWKSDRIYSNIITLALKLK